MVEPTQQFDIKAYMPVLATVYGEAANQPVEVKDHVISSILNRAESGRAEFGANTGKMTDVLKHGYYSYSKQSPKFMEAMEQKFPDKASEDSFKEILARFSAIMRGKVKRTDALFFLKPAEAKRMRQTGAMNMDLLEPIDKQGDFTFYKYKATPPTKPSAGKRKTPRTAK